MTATTTKAKTTASAAVAWQAALITFLTYASVYAFRKPFSAGTYSDAPLVFGLAYKDALVISQVLGYMLSKFYGIKFIAELKRIGRGKILLLLVGISWLALLLFALVPAPYNVVFLFFNGFPLGIIWGIVFSFVEGRKTSDFIGASLAVSFIFSSGFVKSVGKWLMVDWGVSEWWMPFMTGLVFALPLIVLVWLLERIPPPSETDQLERVERRPLNRPERNAFLKQFGLGMVSLVIAYIFLTVFRDIRDNFAADMWKEMGYEDQPAIFTQTEIPITLICLATMALMMLVRNNWRATFITHGIIIGGFLIAGISSYLFIQGVLPPMVWMTLVGLGLYLGYIPFNCILFDRLIAAFGMSGNVGFLMYMADSFGYMGSMGVILLKTTSSIHWQWVRFYSTGVMIVSAVGIVASVVAIGYFSKKHRTLAG